MFVKTTWIVRSKVMAEVTGFDSREIRVEVCRDEDVEVDIKNCEKMMPTYFKPDVEMMCPVASGGSQVQHFQTEHMSTTDLDYQTSFFFIKTCRSGAWSQREDTAKEAPNYSHTGGFAASFIGIMEKLAKPSEYLQIQKLAPDRFAFVCLAQK